MGRRERPTGHSREQGARAITPFDGDVDRRGRGRGDRAADRRRATLQDRRHRGEPERRRRGRVDARLRGRQPRRRLLFPGAFDGLPAEVEEQLEQLLGHRPSPCLETGEVEGELEAVGLAEHVQQQRDLDLASALAGGPVELGTFHAEELRVRQLVGEAVEVVLDAQTGDVRHQIDVGDRGDHLVVQVRERRIPVGRHDAADEVADRRHRNLDRARAVRRIELVEPPAGPRREIPVALPVDAALVGLVVLVEPPARRRRVGDVHVRFVTDELGVGRQRRVRRHQVADRFHRVDQTVHPVGHVDACRDEGIPGLGEVRDRVLRQQLERLVEIVEAVGDPSELVGDLRAQELVEVGAQGHAQCHVAVERRHPQRIDTDGGLPVDLRFERPERRQVPVELELGLRERCHGDLHRQSPAAEVVDRHPTRHGEDRRLAELQPEIDEGIVERHRTELERTDRTRREDPVETHGHLRRGEAPLRAIGDALDRIDPGAERRAAIGLVGRIATGAVAQRIDPELTGDPEPRLETQRRIGSDREHQLDVLELEVGQRRQIETALLPGDHLLEEHRVGHAEATHVGPHPGEVRGDRHEWWVRQRSDARAGAERRSQRRVGDRRVTVVDRDVAQEAHVDTNWSTGRAGHGHTDLRQQVVHHEPIEAGRVERVLPSGVGLQTTLE